MIKGIISALLLVFSFQANASHFSNIVKMEQSVKILASTLGLNWKVGDNADYDLDMGFFKGSMHSAVREEVPEGFWVQQDVDMGLAGKQKMEILFDKDTGQALRLIVNGKEEEVPEGNDNMEVVEMKEASITVKAGTFDCVHLVIRNKETQEESQVWINPQIVPINGMIKSISPGQMGSDITMELTAFLKQ